MIPYSREKSTSSKRGLELLQIGEKFHDFGPWRREQSLPATRGPGLLQIGENILMDLGGDDSII